MQGSLPIQECNSEERDATTRHYCGCLESLDLDAEAV